MRTLLTFLGAVLALWAITRLLEPRLTWYPVRGLHADPGAFGLRFEPVAVDAADGARLRGWYCLPPEGVAHRADLVFFNGNAGNVAHRLPKIRGLAAAGLGVFIVDYRGAGDSDGSPGDASALRDAAAVHRAARARADAAGRPLGVYGESIGALLAVREAAADRQTAFVVLEGSFPAKRALAARLPALWPFLPFVSGTLDMGRHPAGIAAPVLVMHAADDEVVPVALGRRVHERLAASRLREWYEVPRGGHNDAFAADPAFFARIAAFLGRALR